MASVARSRRPQSLSGNFASLTPVEKMSEGWGVVATAIVIEDDDDIRGLLEVVLGQSGVEVTAVASGAAGLEAIQAQEPDLLLVDVGLPDMEGYDLVRQVRPQLSGRIVMLSARSQEADVRQGLDAGADEYLTKPFRPRELRERLAELLDRSVKR